MHTPANSWEGDTLISLRMDYRIYCSSIYNAQHLVNSFSDNTNPFISLLFVVINSNKLLIILLYLISHCCFYGIYVSMVIYIIVIIICFSVQWYTYVCNDFVVMVTVLYNSLNNSCYAPHILTYLIKWMTWVWLEPWISVDCCLATTQQIAHLQALSWGKEDITGYPSCCQVNTV